MIYKILILVVLIALSAFFSGIETAFVSLSRTRVKYLAHKKVKGIKYVEKLKSYPRRLIITILIGNNVVNISASALATSLSIDLLSNYNFPFASPVGIAVGVMTFFILVFGEIIPKVYSQLNATKICLNLGFTVWILSIILYPIVWIFVKISKLATKIAGGDPKTERLSEEEIKSIVHIGYKDGAIENIEKELIHNVLDFDEKKVKEVMVHKKNMLSVSYDLKAEKALDVFMESGFNRVAVHRYKKSNIVGFISLWNTLRILKNAKNPKKIIVGNTMKRPFYTTPNLHLDSLFKEMKKRKNHIAFVRNQKKQVIGLVTDQDLLDEFFGEKFEEPHPSILKKRI